MKKYGIMSLMEFKERTKSIARGEYKPSPDEPKKFFESQEAADRYYLKVYGNETESEPLLMAVQGRPAYPKKAVS